MAGTRRNGTLGTPMSRGELIGGFLYLPIYTIGLGLLLELILNLLHVQLPATRVNLIYFLLNFLIIAAIFHRWLIASLSGIGRRFWPFLQAVVLGFVFYYALSWLLSLVLTLLELAVTSPNDVYISELAAGDFRLMVLCVVFLAPPVEETLFRGLLFGNIHRKNRILAYAVSALLFAVLHVWAYVGSVGWTQAALAAVAYLPAGIALGWTYEKSDTIWAPIVVHALINAVSMGILHGFGG